MSILVHSFKKVRKTDKSIYLYGLPSNFLLKFIQKYAIIKVNRSGISP